MLYRIYAILLFTIFPLAAQGLRPLPSAEIARRIKHLANTGSVLYIAAHPDDENTALLAYCSRGLGLRTGYLSLTRGDGGQNLIGNEQGEDLGLLRTYELLAARDIDGAEQFFTRAYDFGYSKSPAETFRFWNHDTLLADVVSILRQFKPDVIITRFPVTGEGGHGQHTASAILANEAFAAAADPEYYPGNNRALAPWQAEAIYWDAWPPLLKSKGIAADTLLRLNSGALDPVTGKTFTEIAAESRSMHKCQGMGVTPNRGTGTQYLVLTGGTPTSLFSTGKPVQGTAADAIAGCLKGFNPLHPAASCSQLAALRPMLLAAGLPRHARQAGLLLLACAGIEMLATAERHTYFPGDTLRFQLGARAEVPSAVTITGPAAATAPMQLLPGVFATVQAQYVIPADARADNPYWLQQPRQGALYASPASMEAAGSPAFTVPLQMVIGTDTIAYTLPVDYRWNDQADGEQFRRPALLPAASVTYTDPLYIARPGKPFTVTIRVSAPGGAVRGTLLPGSAGGISFNPASQQCMLEKGEEQVFTFTASAAGSPRSGRITAQLVTGGVTYSNTAREIHYPHIPRLYRLQPAEAAVLFTTARAAAGRIAYIQGSGDAIPAVLVSGGISITLLDNRITAEALKPFSTVVLGVRALNTRQPLRERYHILMDFVRNGGTLLAQYNVAQDPLPDSLGPFPFTLTGQRVTDETALVTTVNSHTLLTTPNHITREDFDGWVQERGLYFAGNADKRYEQPLAMHDPGEDNNSGSLLYARYGKGVYIYTSLSFFRQLPAGVPGAYALFLNLLSAR